MSSAPESVSAAAAASSSYSLTCNVKYITSPGGMLKITEFIFGLICWALIVATAIANCNGRNCSGYPAYQFVLFVSITAWISTFILLGIYAFALHATACPGIPWAIIEMVFNVVWALFYFAASCVIAANTNSINNLIAATFFAFLTTTCYIVHCVFAFREWKGRFPCSS